MKRYLLLFVLLLVAIGFAAKPTVLLVANDIDYSVSSSLPGFLGGKGLEVTRITAVEFEENKNAHFMVILGGPDSPDGIGEISTFALSPEEKSYIRGEGNRKMYVKTNVWRTPQVVMVMAGSNRHGTGNAVEGNREGLINRIKSESFNMEIKGAKTQTGDDLIWNMNDVERLIVDTQPLYGKTWKRDYDVNIGKEGITARLLSGTKEYQLQPFKASSDDSNVNYELTFNKPESIPAEFCDTPLKLHIKMEYNGEEDDDEIEGLTITNC
ncbi:hypothetical protein ACFLQI_01920 [Candidatus Undinarchaeota archaeon]